MIVQPADLPTWLEDIRNADKPFSFSRWGDGEWRSVLGTRDAANCDGHTYFLDMGKQLDQVLRSKPQYRLGMQPLALRIFGDQIEPYLNQRKLTELTWHDVDVFHSGAVLKKLGDIVAAVTARKTLIVGPEHLKELKNKDFPFWQHLIIPSKNVFLHLKQVYAQIKELLDVANEPVLVSLSASMPAGILLDWLYPDFGNKHTIIDFGSLWDPIVGVKSRKYMRGAPI